MQKYLSNPMILIALAAGLAWVAIKYAPAGVMKFLRNPWATLAAGVIVAVLLFEKLGKKAAPAAAA